MSYTLGAALQAAVYETLTQDPAVSGLVGDAIFDNAPAGAEPQLYAVLGIEDVFARNDKTGTGALHRFTVGVVSNEAGFASGKVLAAAISDALHGAQPVMSRGRIVSMNFERARARRTGPEQRRQINLRFAARVEDA
ncbi:DUF3168 domain-containing protein [Actibacterium sp. 188UL27-1]|uniref:DUF3168 domain-containing protein n=1 Tax=Actibacterium sp. 188UL27-1 TaxID=2786961 RepID=UPI001959F837|nr:DUF3168 domain-containing protein [Actibacterium sp. 188UL27-1]MBM7068036.1 DUF3168 domain-containing protein [Actibacterium sp. 188UL27-1]